MEAYKKTNEISSESSTSRKMSQVQLPGGLEKLPCFLDCSSIPFCDVCISTGLGDEVKCVLCSGRRKPSPNGDICERQGFQNFQVGVNSTEGALTPLGSFFEDSNRDN